jgi:hypothetical protein
MCGVQCAENWNLAQMQNGVSVLKITHTEINNLERI